MESGTWDKGTPRQSDRRLEKALEHPLRAQILDVLSKGLVGLPELAVALDVPLPRIAYHYRVLGTLGAVASPKV